MNAHPAPTGYALVVDSTGERYTIDRKLVIGRESAEIAVDDLEASRRHATIRPLDDGGLELYDLDSANGTFVNELCASASSRCDSSRETSFASAGARCESSARRARPNESGCRP